MHQCIYDLLFNGPQHSDDIAILAPGTVPLTYGGLRAQVSGIVKALNGMGYGRNDRIAIVLPNGPEMAIAFLSVASGFTCAPLNPLYGQPEFEFYLSDLKARALIVLSGVPSPSIDAARALNIPVIELKPSGKEAGLFELAGESVAKHEDTGFASAGDIALVLHTSGTTSRPKRVPLTQANICASASNILESLSLDRDDRCVNVMPLFHIHGLIGALLSSMAAGASIVCTPGFVAAEFIGWMREFRPTWYTAVPTIHQKVLELARDGSMEQISLRFIRSSSSAMPVSVMRGLEERFGVPVIEAYGMTEASHQIASNPLPPGTRLPGSVGIPRGTRVAILGSNGSVLPADDSGEVAVRGPNVTSGYENAPEANAAAFFNGWLRTGDTGYLDASGYLHLLGRLKEIINRGGEKVSPFEVEEALLAHPAVKEAAAFPVRDTTLGEEVGAAVVLRQNATVSELKEFLAARLAYFKVPTRLLIIDIIPKGPTGKVSRVNMAEMLGITGSKRDKSLEKAAPAPGIEAELAKIWAEVLKHSDIQASDNFLELGGDSLMATRVISRIRAVLGVEVPIISLLDADDLSSFARVMERRLNGHAADTKGEKAREKV
jgi:acyl-CoA synthetase (AMP-forming)/AMP-acid ligase II/acyl carrier protein